MSDSKLIDWFRYRNTAVGSFSCDYRLYGVPICCIPKRSQKWISQSNFFLTL